MINPLVLVNFISKTFLQKSQFPLRFPILVPHLNTSGNQVPCPVLHENKNQILIPILVSKFWFLANWCTGRFRVHSAPGGGFIRIRGLCEADLSVATALGMPSSEGLALSNNWYRFIFPHDTHWITHRV
jgi:hypothetical protein